MFFQESWLCCAVLWVLCCAVLLCAMLCCVVLCCAVSCCAVLCCAVLCCCAALISRSHVTLQDKMWISKKSSQAQIMKSESCFGASSFSTKRGFSSTLTLLHFIEWVRRRGADNGCFFSDVLCCIVLCCAVLCCHVLCCVVLCCVVLCRVVPYCAVLCCAVVLTDSQWRRDCW